MLNEEIVKAGYANLLTYPPNVKYQERYQKAYREARKNKRRLWRSTP
jgi:micrococcal nuclease